MSLLKKEVQIKIDGKHIKGSIINGRFRTSNLVNVEQRNINNGITSSLLDDIIKELLELKELVEANEIVETLANDETPHVDFDFFLNQNQSVKKGTPRSAAKRKIDDDDWFS
ncbi:hypothetical protein D3C87_76910 [compost metagenome]